MQRKLHNDEEIMQAMRQGDYAACQQTCETYAIGLFQYVYTLIRDRHWAEDVVQDTFHRFFLAVREGAKVEKIKEYLYHSARNIALNRLRTESRQKKRIQSLAVTEDDYQDEPYADLQKREDRNLLYQAINALPEEQRETVILKINCDYTFEEIASLCDSNVNTVYKRYQLALGKIREQMQ